jgi:hypothetical protein
MKVTFTEPLLQPYTKMDKPEFMNNRKFYHQDYVMPCRDYQNGVFMGLIFDGLSMMIFSQKSFQLKLKFKKANLRWWTDYLLWWNSLENGWTTLKTNYRMVKYSEMKKLKNKFINHESLYNYEYVKIQQTHINNIENSTDSNVNEI